MLDKSIIKMWQKVKQLRYLLLLVHSIGISGSAWAQQDSLLLENQPFTVEEMVEIVLQHHPIIKQAGLMDDVAAQELLMARGLLDPKLMSSFDTKEFGGTQYYQKWDSKLKVPLWFPTDLQVGYEQNQGNYLSDELSNTADGLVYAGLSVPLGRGLFMDQRRSAIRQAQALQTMTLADQIKEVNKLLVSALKAYWEWYFAHQQYLIISEVEDVALRRYQGVVQRVKNGDIAPFDSLKAYINYQERDIQRTQTRLELQNTQQQVSVFLWRSMPEEGMAMLPLELSPGTFPVVDTTNYSPVDLSSFAALQEFAQENHPELIKTIAKSKQLKVEQQLAREFLKPEINLKYNVLTKPTSGSKSAGDGAERSVFLNDYKLGAEFYFPLFLRKERGKLAQTNLKLEQLHYEQTYQRQLINNLLMIAYNSLTNVYQLIEQQAQMVEYYRRLLDGELQKFEMGESSVFLINTRETELLDARIKLLKLQTQREKAKLELLYQSGMPNLSLSETSW